MGGWSFRGHTDLELVLHDDRGAPQITQLIFSIEVRAETVLKEDRSISPQREDAELQGAIALLCGKPPQSDKPGKPIIEVVVEELAFGRNPGHVTRVIELQKQIADCAALNIGLDSYRPLRGQVEILITRSHRHSMRAP